MSSALRISEATSLALHTMAVLARDPSEGLSSKEIATRLGVSQAHLQKVLQRLGRSGLVSSERGRSGGFRLGRTAQDITLQDVYESIEGPLQFRDCLLNRPACTGGKCVLGGLVASVNAEFARYLGQTTVAALAGGGATPATGAPKGRAR